MSSALSTSYIFILAIKNIGSLPYHQRSRLSPALGLEASLATCCSSRTPYAYSFGSNVACFAYFHSSWDREMFGPIRGTIVPRRQCWCLVFVRWSFCEWIARLNSLCFCTQGCRPFIWWPLRMLPTVPCVWMLGCRWDKTTWTISFAVVCLGSLYEGTCFRTRRLRSFSVCSWVLGRLAVVPCWLSFGIPGRCRFLCWVCRSSTEWVAGGWWSCIWFLPSGSRCSSVPGFWGRWTGTSSTILSMLPFRASPVLRNCPSFVRRAAGSLCRRLGYLSSLRADAESSSSGLSYRCSNKI